MARVSNDAVRNKISEMIAGAKPTSCYEWPAELHILHEVMNDAIEMDDDTRKLFEEWTYRAFMLGKDMGRRVGYQQAKIAKGKK